MADDLITDFRAFKGGANGDSAHANLQTYRADNPEDNAKRAALAKRWGVGLDTAKAQQPMLERAARTEADQKTLSTAPATAAFLAKDPVHAAVSHDIVGEISEAEVFANKVKAYGKWLGVAPRALVSGLPSITQGLWGIVATTGALAEDAGLPGAGAVKRYGLEGAQTNKQVAEAIAGEATTWGGRMVQGAAQSAGVQLPGLAATVLTKNPAYMLGTGAAVVGGQSATRALEQGVSAPKAALYGVLDASAEAIFEKLPLSRLLGDLGGGASFRKLLAGQLATELPTEVATTITQNLNEWALVNPDKSVSEFLAEQPEAIRDTIAQTILQVGGMSGAAYGIDRVAKRVAETDAKAEAAPEGLKTFNDLAKATTALPLRERSPEAFQALMEEIAPGVDVHVKAETLFTFLQSMELTEAEALIDATGIRDQLAAATLETDIVIPAARYLSQIAPTPAHAALENDLKIGPAGMSINEAEESKGEREQLLEAAATRALSKGAAALTEGDPSAERVREDFYQQALAAGVPEAQARENAAIQADYYTRRAQRNTTFVDAWDAYEKTGLSIQAGGANASGDVFSLFKQDARLVPAIRAPNGKLFKGKPGEAHSSIINRLRREGFDIETVLNDRSQNPFVFSNQKGQVLEREAALQYAFDNGLIAPEHQTRVAGWAKNNGGSLMGLGMSTDFLPRTSDEDTFEQSVDLRNKTETLQKFGLNPAKKHNTRDVAAALEARQRKRFGQIGRTDRSPAARKRIARWMADEVNFELQLPGSSGVGWYSTKFQAALDIFAEQFPELATDQSARDTLTALIAITSDGQKVLPNFRQAVDLYANFRETGKFTTTRGHQRQDSVDNNVAKIQVLYETYGPQGMRDMLMQEAPISELKRKAKALGVEFSTKYPATTKMPYAAVIFGPKLGAFYANLMGAEGYLTMDRWWSRTFNRYRGDLLDTPNETGVARVRELVAKDLGVEPDAVSDEQLYTEVKKHRDAYAARGFKSGNEIEKAANTLHKAAFENINDQPFSATDRGFMIDVVQEARALLAKGGTDISVADIQAVLWYYEKRLYGDLGARQSGDVSYEETAQRVVSERAGPSGPTAPVDGVADLGADIEAAAPSSGERAYYDPARDAPSGTFQQGVTPDADGMITLSHFSSKGRIKQLDPTRFGDNYEILSDEEKMTLDDAIPRTYWGIGTGQPGEYQPELGIGDHRYEAKIAAADLYDGTADPQGFRAQAEAAVREDVGEDDISDYQAEVLLGFEQAIKDAGFKGYMTQGGSTHTGPVAAVFENPKHTYKGRYTEPRAATLDDFTPKNLKTLLSKQNWTILTAENPAARTDLSPEENAALNTALEARLTEKGKTFHKVEGHYGQEENSYLVLDVNETEALQLGREFGQESVLTRRGLVYADGTYQPATGITVHKTPPEDFYSRVPETGGLFSVDIDFDQRLDLPATTMQQGPRGQVSFSDGQALVQLFKTRNASTLVHEAAGHIWLENLGRDAADPNASDEVRADLEIIKNWWRQNAPEGSNLKAVDDFGVRPVKADDIRPFHEMFARAAERYFMEGKSPTPELRGAFAKLRQWLVAIYKDFSKLNVPMSDEVRGVFDRLIAVPQALDAAQDEQNLDPFFKDAASAGMSQEEYDAYLNAIRIADETGHDRLLGKVMADIRRTRTAAWKAERAALVEEYQEQVDATPEMQALSLLETGEVRIARQAVVDAGIDEAQLYRRQRPYVFDEGVEPDQIAEQVGMSSGTALLQALVGMKAEHDALRAEGDKRTVRLARAEALADAEMVARHGDILNDGTIGDEAVAAINDLRRSEVLMAEVRALIRKAGAVTAIWTPAEMQAWAERQIAARRLDGIRPNVYRMAEAKAGRDALKALVKDDFQAALDAKFRQLLNMHLFRAARDAREDVDKGKALFDRIVKARNGTIAKSRNMDMVEAARAILAAYGFGSPKNDSDYLAKVKEYDPELWADLEIGVTAALAGAKPVDELTLDEFTSLRTVVDQLWRMSRTSRQMEIDFQTLEVGDIADDLAQQLKDAPVNVGPTHNATGREIIARTVAAWRAHLRRVESWTTARDGGPKGPWRTYVWQPISDAAARYRLAKLDYMTRFVALLEPINAGLKRGKIEAPELNHVFGGGNNGVGKSELLHAILHTGNESNKRKLLLGRGWATEDANGNLITTQWDAFVSRMQREGVLTKADYDFAQSVWDLLEEMKPAAQKAHRQVFGRYFEEVTANSFNTPYGTYKGGYVPALVDPFIVQDAALKAGAEAVEEGNTANMFPSPARGFTKSRVEYNRPLALDLGLLPQHIDKVLKFAHLTVPVRDVLRLLKEKGLSTKLEALDPTAVTDMLLPWLNRTARQVVETPSTSTAGRKIDGVLRAVRSRSGMGIMMFNLSNTMQQLTGWFPAALKVRKRHLTRALWTYVRDPGLLAESVAAASPFMATRLSGQMSDITERLDQLLLDPSKYQKIADFTQRHAYVLQGMTQNLVDLVTWQGAFEQGLSEGLEFVEAVRLADNAIRETQGSLAPEDVSAWEAGSALKRLFTQFYSYFSAQGNLLSTEGQNAKTLTRAGYIYVMGLLLPAVVSEIIRVSFGKGWDDEDDDGYLDMYLDLFFGSQFRYATAAVPLVGAMVNLVTNGFNDKRYDDALVVTPVQSTLTQAAAAPKDIYRAVTEGKGQKAAVRDTTTLLTLVTGVPLFAAAGRPLGYLADINEGKVQPTGPVDFARGLVTGTASEASKVN